MFISSPTRTSCILVIFISLSLLHTELLTWLHTLSTTLLLISPCPKDKMSPVRKALWPRLLQTPAPMDSPASLHTILVPVSTNIAPPAPNRGSTRASTVQDGNLRSLTSTTSPAPPSTPSTRASVSPANSTISTSSPRIRARISHPPSLPSSLCRSLPATRTQTTAPTGHLDLCRCHAITILTTAVTATAYRITSSRGRRTCVASSTARTITSLWR